MPAQLGYAPDPSGRKSVSAILVTASATGAIQSCAYEARSQLNLDIETRIKAASEAIRNMTRQIRVLPLQKRSQLESVRDDVKIQDGARRRTLQAAQKASTKSWPEGRAALAFSYIDYVGAVSRAELIVAQSNKG